MVELVCSSSAATILGRPGRTWNPDPAAAYPGQEQTAPPPPEIWILPVEYEGLGDVAFMRSTRQESGRSYDCLGGGAYLDQPTLVQLSNGDLMAYMRSWEGFIYRDSLS